MNTYCSVPRADKGIPEIVRSVLKQLGRMRRNPGIAAKTFEEKIHRLTAEELDPRGLSLLVRDLSDGHTRFIIKDCSTRRVVDMLECA